MLPSSKWYTRHPITAGKSDRVIEISINGLISQAPVFINNIDIPHCSDFGRNLVKPIAIN